MLAQARHIRTRLLQVADGLLFALPLVGVLAPLVLASQGFYEPPRIPSRRAVILRVLRGEMSLVGPRPLPLAEIKRFADDAHRRRRSVKPGLTCLWPISGRNDIADFDDWVRLDLASVDQWSLWLDLKILIATIPVALPGRGGR